MFCIHKIIGSNPITSITRKFSTPNTNHKAMDQIKNPRLKLHYFSFGKFDLLDKNTSFTPKNLCECSLSDLTLHTQVVSRDSSVFSDKPTIVSSALTSEWLTNQRFFFKYSKEKTFSNNTYFTITLRKNKLFWFLESCLNHVFINENSKFLFLYQQKSFLFQDNQLSSKLHFMYPSRLINCFQSLPNKTTFTFLLNFKPTSANKLEVLDLYFIPR